MKITVQCHCGRPFRFDDEPVNGRIQHRVTCPNCGADATSKANDFIAAAQQGKAVPAPEFGDGEDESAEPAAGPVRVLMGAIGAVAGGLLGMGGWYLLARSTGFQLPFVALAVGALVGAGVRLFVPQGSFALAGVAALTACLAILGGQTLGFKFWMDRELAVQVRKAYGIRQSEARRALGVQRDTDELGGIISSPDFRLRAAALPGEEKTLRTYYRVLAQIESTSFGVISSGGHRTTMADRFKADSSLVTEAELAEFREKDVPELQALADGKPSQAEFEQKLNAMLQARISWNDLILQSMSMYSFLFLFLGIGTAWKLANNRSDAVIE